MPVFTPKILFGDQWIWFENNLQASINVEQFEKIFDYKLESKAIMFSIYLYVQPKTHSETQDKLFIYYSTDTTDTTANTADTKTGEFTINVPKNAEYNLLRVLYDWMVQNS